MNQSAASYAFQMKMLLALAGLFHILITGAGAFFQKKFAYLPLRNQAIQITIDGGFADGAFLATQMPGNLVRRYMAVFMIDQILQNLRSLLGMVGLHGKRKHLLN